ncbi:MAG: DUF47 domain-containing protein [Lentisphaerae bacterium]|nr:DUF47 domain-containing protein [Lentisphaerota bacterium]
MFNLLPTNYKFFDQFDKATELVVTAAEQLRDNIEQNWRNQDCAETIKRMEHAADEIAHETMEMLHKSFVTPLDRGDIRRLTFAIDNIIDLINDAGRWFTLYELKEILPDAKKMAAILAAASRVIQQAVKELPRLRRVNNILKCSIEINRLENEADHIMHQAISGLFKSGMDPLLIMKWKEVYEYLEDAIDCCEDCANVLEGIAQENG